ncbi:MAG: hypothetical protein HYV07_25290 [Deltaproteobacteria bacterium]|nr:hypothetical protein [Deltaproteobacteria bacterium]
MRRECVLTAFVTLLLARTAAADRPDLVFVVDPKLGMESGVRTIESLSRITFLYDESLRKLTQLDESEPTGKLLGVLGRGLQLSFLDGPIAGLATVLIHEVFGHGARAREAGMSPTYEFQLLPPYNWIFGRPAGHLAQTLSADSGVLERDLSMITAGVEAEHLEAFWILAGAARNDFRVRRSELMLYVLAKLTYADEYLQAPGIVDDSLGDVYRYVELLASRFNRWRPGERQEIHDRLSIAYVFHFVDPVFWVALVELTVGFLWRGEREHELPTLTVGSFRALPLARVLASPFGAEHSIEVLLANDALALDVRGRFVSSGLATAFGVGGQLMGLDLGHGFTFGGALDVWWQPRVIFEQRLVFERDDLPGASVAAYVDWTIHGGVGLTGKLALKSRGYLFGQPLDGGVYGYAGLRIGPAPVARPAAAK